MTEVTGRILHIYEHGDGRIRVNKQIIISPEDIEKGLKPDGSVVINIPILFLNQDHNNPNIVKGAKIVEEVLFGYLKDEHGNIYIVDEMPAQRTKNKRSKNAGNKTN